MKIGPKNQYNFGPIPIENKSVNDDPSIFTDMDNIIHNWKNNSENSSYSHGDYLVDIVHIRNFLYDKTFLVRDSNRNSYSIYFAISDAFKNLYIYLGTLYDINSK